MVLLSLLSAGVAVAAPIHISPDDGSLEQALEHAVEGDILMFRDGVYAPFTVNNGAFTMVPEAGAQVILTGVVVEAGARVSISDMIVAESHQGLDVAGELELNNSTLRGLGGWESSYAVRVQSGGVATLAGVAITDSAGEDGAIQVHSGGRLEAFDLLAEDNTRLFSINGGTAEVTAAQIRGSRDGAIRAASGELTLSDVHFRGHLSEGQGGALYVGAGARVQAEDTSWREGAAAEGGHIFVDGGELTLVRAWMVDGDAAVDGGGIVVAGGAVSARNVFFQGLSAATVGGAISVRSGSADIRYAIMKHNSATTGASVAVAEGAAAQVQNTIFLDHRMGAVFSNDDGEHIPVFASLTYGNRVPFADGQVVTVDMMEEADPLFLDPAAENFVLTTGSPALDTAFGLDLDGTGGDMGIYGGPDAWPLADRDGDGFVFGRDCDDRDSTVNESRVDLWYDGIDSDCSGNNDYDMDGDGFGSARYTEDGDCDDANPDRNPGAVEADFADNLDSDCDLLDMADADGDGWPVDVDCDDNDAARSPGNLEIWYDGVDGDCSGTNDYDQDGDGYSAYGATDGEDCDDSNPFISPESTEVPGDGIDQDCDGQDAEIETDPAETVSAVEGESTVKEEPWTPPYQRPSSITATAGCSSTNNGPGNAGLALAGLSLLGIALSRRRRQA